MMGDSVRTLQRRVIEHIRVERLWSAGQSVLVAVSGGVDSTVLLHVLNRTQSAHKGVLSVMSLDHGLRPECPDEIASVAKMAYEMGLPFESRQLELQDGPNLAERARDARRAALLSIAKDCIATGHHQDDQAETVFFHLLRGSGLRGLQGMQAKNGPWVRPLLRESRDTLLSWAGSEALTWFEDPSNPKSQRGKIRSLMPVLNDFRDGASSALARTARLLAREDDYLSHVVDQLWDDIAVGNALNRALLARQHPAIQLRLIRRLLNDVRIRADMLESVVQGALMTHGQLDLGHGVRLVCRQGQLNVERD